MKNILKSTQNKIIAGVVASVIVVGAAGAVAVKMDKLQLPDLKAPVVTEEVATEQVTPTESTPATVGTDTTGKDELLGKSHPASQK